MQTYYKLAFQTLKNLFDLQIISEVEKTLMKEYIVKQILKAQINITQDQMSHIILQKIQNIRNKQQRTKCGSDSLLSIEEETDEDF